MLRQSSAADSGPVPLARPDDTPFRRRAPVTRFGRWRSIFLVRGPEAALQGLRQLAAYRLRTALALSGIVVGVAALVGSLALLDGAEQMVVDLFERMGGTRAGRVMAQNGTFRFGRWMPSQKVYQLNRDDATALAASLPEVETTCPGHVTFGVTAEGGKEKFPGVLTWGLGPNHSDIRPVTILHGRNFSAAEEAAAAPVALVFETLARELFGRIDIVGEEIRLNGVRFTVIGVVRWPAGGNRKWVYIPFETMQSRLDKNKTVFIWYRLRAGVAFADFKGDLLRFLIGRHPGSKPADYAAFSWGERQDNELRTIRTQGRVLISVAGLCLLAGGIGVLNVFLISATERTREIGLRIALGASRRAVLGQFLFEATLLCAIGGAIGVILAAGVAEGFAYVVRARMSSGSGFGPRELNVSIGFGGVALGFGVSFLTAVVFGSFPAWRASRYDPAKSLRSE